MNKIWVFGSGNGYTYADNSRALFEYVNRECPDVKAVWLTSNADIRDRIRRDSNSAYTFYSPKGLYYGLFSEVIVITNSFLDVSLVSYLIPWHKTIAQLWHGTALKVLENMPWPPLKKLAIKTFLFYVGRDCDMVFSATPMNTDAFKKNFNVTEEQIHITGQPRNDFLFKNKPGVDTKNIWYIPTFREFDREYDFFGANGFDPAKLNNLLRKNNAHLYLKLHNVDRAKFAKYSSQFKELTNIEAVNPDNLYDELSKADVLITDYSSVYFDFLLLDRPIIFAAFDYSTYLKKRNFYYKYDDVTPGPKAHDWDSVARELENIFNGVDNYKEHRHKVNNLFNSYKDDNSSKRVFEIIVE